MNVLRRTWGRYQLALQRHPLKMQSLQASVLMGTGDVVAQTYVEGKPLRNVDGARVLRFSSIGVCIGPALLRWYGWLDRVAGPTGGRAVAGKVLLDQAVAAPAMLCAVLSAVSLLGGADLPGVAAKLRQDYVPVLLANYKVWPAVQLCNFTLVPLRYRVLVVQTVAVLWNTYLSRRANCPVPV
ncbi:protein Mpv17 isoform X2 [Bacillus rossius redtenbacheri]